jgi:hypothetical protein
MSLQLIKSDYNGIEINFTEAGWFNATEVSAKYGKRPNDWLNLPATKEYLAALMDDEQSDKISLWVKTKKGGDTRKSGIAQGTWLHPKLGVAFARWLDVKFAVWCDKQVDAIVRNKHPHFDKKKLRHSTASTNKVMNAILEYTRLDQGKLTESKHYMCEAKLVNWALTGKFAGLNRDHLSASDLSIPAQLEERNAVLIGRGLVYENRKTILHQLALDIKAGPLRLAA